MSDNVLVQLTRKGLYLSALSEPNININLNYGTVVNFFFFILEINSVEGSYKCLAGLMGQFLYTFIVAGRLWTQWSLGKDFPRSILAKNRLSHLKNYYYL